MYIMKFRTKMGINDVHLPLFYVYIHLMVIPFVQQHLSKLKNLSRLVWSIQAFWEDRKMAPPLAPPT